MSRPWASEPRSVLMLVAERDGGAPEHVRVLTHALLGRGYRVCVLGPGDARIRADVVAAGAQFGPVPIAVEMLTPGHDARALAATARAVGLLSPDIVHAHGEKGGMVGRVAARLCGVPAVYSPHDLGYRSQLLRDRPTARLRRAAVVAMERRLGRRTGALLACSDDERDTALADRLVPPGRVWTFRYGVAPDTRAEPEPSLVRFADGRPLFGCLCGLREQKDLPTLLDALALGSASAESVPYRFAIVGNGPLRGYVERRIRDERLDGHVLLAPFRGDVGPYLSAMDTFVLTSRWEGLPIAIVEAMAMGLPVIATRVNGTPEAVRHEDTGLLVPPRDAPAVLRAITRLAGDPGARARMGARGRAVAETHFSVEGMVEDIEAAYAAALTFARR